MKISVDDQELFTLSEVQKSVIKNDILEAEFEQDMRRRLQYILTHKYERCLERMKAEWMPILQARLSSVPTDDQALAQLIMSQPEYRNRSQREQLQAQAEPQGT